MRLYQSRLIESPGQSDSLLFSERERERERDNVVAKSSRFKCGCHGMDMLYIIKYGLPLIIHFRKTNSEDNNGDFPKRCKRVRLENGAELLLSAFVHSRERQRYLI